MTRPYSYTISSRFASAPATDAVLALLRRRKAEGLPPISVTEIHGELQGTCRQTYVNVIRSLAASGQIVGSVRRVPSTFMPGRTTTVPVWEAKGVGDG